MLASVAAWQSPVSAAPASYEVPRFSDQFGATVVVDDPADETSLGTVTVFERASSKTLFTVSGSALPNPTSQAPSNRDPTVIIYEDFDFDGQRDLAVRDGNDSCYGQPSYRVFLRAAGGFVASEAFTDLVTSGCGMFSVDAKRKHLHTWSKGGCCAYSSREYDVVGHEPRLLHELEETTWQLPYRVTIERTLGQRTKVDYTLLLEEDAEVEPVLAFDLPGPKKQRVELFISQGELDYAFVSGDERNVELSYSLNVAGPVESQGKTAAPFVYNAQAGELAFRNGGYRYVVVDHGKRVGVRVEHQGKSIFLPGILQSQDGALAALSSKKLANLRADAH